MQLMSYALSYTVYILLYVDAQLLLYDLKHAEDSDHSLHRTYLPHGSIKSVRYSIHAFYESSLY